MDVPAWAENAVIFSDNGFNVRFHVRCPYCGKVNHNSTQGASVYAGIANTHGNCPDCHKSFPIKIGRR